MKFLTFWAAALVLCAVAQGAWLDLPARGDDDVSGLALLKTPAPDHRMMTGGMDLLSFSSVRQYFETGSEIVTTDLEPDPRAQAGLPLGVGAVLRAAIEAPEPPSVAMAFIGVCLVAGGVKRKKALRRERHAHPLRRRVRVEHRKMALLV